MIFVYNVTAGSNVKPRFFYSLSYVNFSILSIYQLKSVEWMWHSRNKF